MLNPKLILIVDLTDQNQIKEGDWLIIHDGEKVFCETAKEVLSAEFGEEIILNKRKNKYFNTSLYLTGRSWVKSVKIIRDKKS